MTGTMSDVTFSEAIVKLPHCGGAADTKGYCVNASALLEASLKNAFEVPVGTPEGRSCLPEYITYGYVPHDTCSASVSRTLNYLHSDWALAKAAALLGDGDSAATLSARAARWPLLLNPATGFLAPKLPSGQFWGGFDQFAWGDSRGYTEGGPWQYRLEVPYDPTALAAELANIGIDAAQVVEDANLQAPNFHAGGYGSVIHEQSEMAVNCFGQWSLNNQPSWVMQNIQIAFDSSVTGPKASRAQAWLRKSLGLFRATADMFPGDEDNGSMGAWYILNALGLYPLSPASGDYVIGSPLFANVTVTIDGGAPLVITAINQGPDNVYVQGVSWGGGAVSGVAVAYADLMQGGTLEFIMGPAPAA
jgi:predicted alpha-1,2-mannosidase